MFVGFYIHKSKMKTIKPELECPECLNGLFEFKATADFKIIQSQKCIECGWTKEINDD